MTESRLIDSVKQLAANLLQLKVKLVTAESCTGGGLSEILTSLPGSSVWFERGLVTYSNKAKQELLGVTPETLAEHGAVSEIMVYPLPELPARMGAQRINP